MCSHRGNEKYDMEFQTLKSDNGPQFSATEMKDCSNSFRSDFSMKQAVLYTHKVMGRQRELFKQPNELLSAGDDLAISLLNYAIALVRVESCRITDGTQIVHHFTAASQGSTAWKNKYSTPI